MHKYLSVDKSTSTRRFHALRNSLMLTSSVFFYTSSVKYGSETFLFNDVIANDKDARTHAFSRRSRPFVHLVHRVNKSLLFLNR